MLEFVVVEAEIIICELCEALDNDVSDDDDVDVEVDDDYGFDYDNDNTMISSMMFDSMMLDRQCDAT